LTDVKDWPSGYSMNNSVGAFAPERLMRAMVLPAPRTRLQIEERPDPIPGEGQLRVKVSACEVSASRLNYRRTVLTP